MLLSSNVQLQKTGLQCFASVYPLLFKQTYVLFCPHSCNPQQQLSLMPGRPTTQLYQPESANVGRSRHGQNFGIALVAQWTYGGQARSYQSLAARDSNADSRNSGSKGVLSTRVARRKLARLCLSLLMTPAQLQRTAEPNLAFVPASHAFLKTAALEDEANKLLEECITTLFTSRSSDIISAVTLTLAGLVKIRPGFAQLVITALTNWTPTALATATPGGSSPLQIRSVEKSVRVSLTHLLKCVVARAPVRFSLNR